MFWTAGETSAGFLGAFVVGEGILSSSGTFAGMTGVLLTFFVGKSVPS